MNPGLPARDDSDAPPRRVLLVVAAPREREAVLRGLGVDACLTAPAWDWEPAGPGLALVRTGVGKANASGAVARALALDAFDAVVNVGIAGSLPRPGASDLALGAVVVATVSVFADEGLDAPDGFSDLASMGFAPVEGAAATFAGMGIAGDPVWSARVTGALERAGLDAESGAVATVSTCSGTDARAGAVSARTGAVAEAMEGAAAATACARAGLAFVEARVISNTTGDRSRQRWDLEGALSRLGEVGRALRTL